MNNMSNLYYIDSTMDYIKEFLEDQHIEYTITFDVTFYYICEENENNSVDASNNCIPKL